MANINQWKVGDIISATRLNEMVNAINDILAQQQVDPSNFITTEQLTTILAGYSDVGHTHSIAEIVDLVLPTVPTRTSQLTNDSDYATNASVDEKIANVAAGGQVDLTSYAKKTDLPTKVSQLENDSNFISEVPSEYITETELNAKGYLTEHQSLDNYALKSEIPTVPTKIGQLENDSNFISSIPEEYVTEQELAAKGLATETFVTNKIAEASIGGGSQTIIFEDVLDGEIFKASTACQAIMLSPNELTISDMQPQTIVANLSPDDCTDEVVWSVEPSGVATISNGVVTPITKGSCIVTATCGSKNATCNVTVEEYVLCTGVTLSADTLSFNTSDTQTLTATIQPSNCMQEVIWNIEPAGIVRVENNVVTPLSNGDCTITVTCGNYSDSCTVNVSCFTTMYNITNNLTKATSNNSAATIAGGTTYTATITADPDCSINSYTVTMGGVDITSTAYVNGVITIQNVSGDIVITVVAVSTVAPASTQVMKFVKNDDGTMYYEWDRAKMIEVENYGGNYKKLIDKANSYTNETYSMYLLANGFVSEGVSPNDVDLWKYIPQAKVVETAQSSAMTDTSTVLANNEFYVCNYGSSSKAQYSVRVPNASTADTSANTWLLNLIEQDTIKLPVTTEPTVQYTVNPEYLTNIIIKTHEKDSTIQYAQFANSDPSKPTDNVYSGFNTLFGVTAGNANLSQAPAGIAAMSTSVVSIAFYPGTFQEFTLDNVKAYLREHPLTFYKA